MIDQKIIATYQFVVDETERSPGWWAEQTAWAFIAADVVATALTWKGGWDILWVALTLIFGTSMIICSRDPVQLALIGANGKFQRLGLVALVVIFATLLVFVPSINIASDLLSTFLFSSTQYFAACQPPRPRKRRQTVAQGGAA
jgi:hypothetical protein